LSASTWCWAFEARSIQDYLFETGRLADAVGASLLVDRLTGDLNDAESGGSASGDDLLSQVLRAAQVEPDLSFSRRAGGSFIAFASSRMPLLRARVLWHAALHANAPGLRWSDGVAEAPDAQAAARSALAEAQARGQFDPPRLPEATPAQQRVPRTGHPAERHARLGPRAAEPVDAATLARRRHRNAASSRLTDRFAAGTQWHWPTDLNPDPECENDDEGTAFPFVGGERDVAFIHADGNGLGVLLRRLDASVSAAQYVQTYAAFSRAISQATQAAAAQATQAVLLPACVGARVPARPLVLGGDDLQIIVRADLAIPFVESFLLAFEVHSAHALQPLRKLMGLAQGQGLTAAAGVLVAKASYPFSAAAARAGALCDQAKRAIKREAADVGRAVPLSALALAHAQASLADAAGTDQLASGLTLGLAAYATTTCATTLPRLHDLQALARALAPGAAPRGPARRLITDLHTDLALARERYRRMQQQQGAAWQPVADALAALGVPPQADLPFTAAAASPWIDALLLRDLSPAEDAAHIGFPETA